MAEGKKSFVLYSDQRGLFEKLNSEQAGLLIKHIFSYVNGENPETDFVTELAFESIKTQLERDLEKWENKSIIRSSAGVEGNLKRWNPDIYKAFKAGKYTLKESLIIAKDRKASQSIANIAVNVNVNDNVNDNVNVSKKEKIDKKESKPIPAIIQKNNFKKWIKEDFKNEMKLELREMKKNENLEFARADLLEFYEYWTEQTSSGKIKVSTQKTWSTKRRIKTWMKRAEQYSTKKQPNGYQEVINSVNRYKESLELEKDENPTIQKIGKNHFD